MTTIDSIKAHATIEAAKTAIASILKHSNIPVDDNLVGLLTVYIAGVQENLDHYDNEEDRIQYLLRLLVCNTAIGMIKEEVDT